MQFNGIITPLITPFDAEGGIDWSGWERIMEFQISQGVHGLVVGGTTGEYYALSDDERIEQFHRAKQIVRGRIPIFGGVNALRTEHSVALATAARDSGLDGLLVATPPYSQPADDEIAAHCLAVDRAANLPIMLYNYPARAGAGMGRAFLEQIASEKNFCAIKESSGDINRLHFLAREFSGIQLSCGADDQALEFFAWGATSWVCAAANCLPKEIIALYNACAVHGDFPRGRKIMSALLPIMTLLERGGKFIQCVKASCELAGIPGGNPRLPLRPISKDLEHETAETVATLKAAIAGILATPSQTKTHSA